ncbi:MAG: dienelactone hydrolase family protein [Candidatus Rokuibacteriota bacterium]
MGTMITLTADDGFRLGAYRADPSFKVAKGLVVIQEIFGVNKHMKRVTDAFAADGYVAIAPAIFDRVERDYDTGYSQEEIDRGRATRGKCDLDQLVMDVKAAVTQLKSEGLKVGVVGYCLGGTMAWLAATRIDGIAAAVPYYGGGVAAAANEKPKCPVLLHFGETDASIPADHWETVKKAHPEIPQHIYPAGHGFNCDERGSWHEPSAKLARQRTMEFFAQHLA